ncbi:hypothetical protein POPTR_005G180001v4 [Populus trichocarpa]|uniref:Replication factor C C-terminal domain-containing protein n=1 Tax=Populus trichocarpa TaxID=3694 RepID=A0A3N7EYY3_POPTR|nr:hypothetical protein BDE02_05G149400 [Populus trichocarpa]RQO90713.1 hypothetical protein POPTR_005G180001v4 [Populus trichocarpa]
MLDCKSARKETQSKRQRELKAYYNPYQGQGLWPSPSCLPCQHKWLPSKLQKKLYTRALETHCPKTLRIFEIKTRKGLALVDIVREVTTCYSNRFVFQIKMKSDVRVPLINDLADIEYRLVFGCNDKLHLGSLIASFARARSALVAAAS